MLVGQRALLHAVVRRVQHPFEMICTFIERSAS